jgi:prepilin-type N-terminal cleavage/methylation domain-containing protein
MRKLNSRGYTIIEMITASAIASIVLVGMLSFMVTSIVNNSVNSARADLLREAQFALDVIVKDVRLSAGVDTNNRIEDENSPNAIATAGLGWESDSDTLVLAIAAEDNSDNIIFADAAHYITEKNNIIYYISDDSKLFKRTLAADLPDNDFTLSCPPELATADCPADRLSIENAQNLVFRYFDATDTEVDPASARSVEVELTLHDVKFGRPIDVSYKTRTVFRNE